MENCEKLIKRSFPQINEDIYSYVESMLTIYCYLHNVTSNYIIYSLESVLV